MNAAANTQQRLLYQQVVRQGGLLNLTMVKQSFYFSN